MNEKSILEYHRKGKIEIALKTAKDLSDLPIIYTPGVAEVSKAIFENPELADSLTIRGNSVAVISDGSAVLGLGSLGPLAALPVLEGKCILMKALAGIDAYPILINTQDPKQIIETIKNISSGFRAICLEDISAPRCFEIENALREILPIPVIQDDQSVTATVVYAALKNALKIVEKEIGEIKIVLFGAGASGIATTRFLSNLGVNEMVVFNSTGPIYPGRERMNRFKEEIAKLISARPTSFEEAFEGCDVFIGLSTRDALTNKKEELLQILELMNENPIFFCLSNPDPEISLELLDWLARERKAIIATGRSDRPNQVNNLLAFPGIFRGAIDARASEINFEMLRAAAEAISNQIPKPNQMNFIPEPTDLAVHRAVRDAVYQKVRK